MDETKKEILILKEYIKLSPNRQKVIKLLSEEEILKPTEISKKVDIHVNTVSKSLKQLRENDLVYILNPESRRGRLYKLTEKGKKVSESLKDEDKAN